MASADFTLGVNLPWLDYGGDFGANAWHPSGGLSAGANRERLQRSLERMVDHGLTVARWFLLCDGRSGIRFAPDGTPAGLDDFALKDIDIAVRAAADAGVQLLFVLLDFHWCKAAEVVSGVQLGGRRAVLAHEDKRAALLERVITPVFEQYGQERTIYAWDLVNEPEWVTFGLATFDPRQAVRQATMRGYVGDCARLAHRCVQQPVTVGLASARWLDFARDLDLDFYQVHWYDKLEAGAPLGTRVPAYVMDRPVMLGEFPTRGSGRSAGNILATAREAGYSGALLWSMLATDDVTGFDDALPHVMAFNGRSSAADGRV